MRRLVIAGNGEMPEGAASIIDAANCVIRFNDCRSAGTGGTRTDIVAVCNTGRPGKGMLESPAWRESAPVRAAGEIWCVRDPVKFAALRMPLSLTHPELDDFCDDYTDSFAAFARETGKRHRVIGATCQERLETELAVYAPAPYVVPSSGLVVIAHVLCLPEHAEDEIILAGFGHQGWEWHPFSAERSWVEARLDGRRLSRIETLLAVPA